MRHDWVRFNYVTRWRRTFLHLCASTYRFLNEAALFYKFKHCDENNMNLSKELYLHDLPE